MLSRVLRDIVVIKMNLPVTVILETVFLCPVFIELSSDFTIDTCNKSSIPGFLRELRRDVSVLLHVLYGGTVDWSFICHTSIKMTKHTVKNITRSYQIFIYH